MARGKKHDLKLIAEFEARDLPPEAARAWRRLWITLLRPFDEDIPQSDVSRCKKSIAKNVASDAQTVD